MRSVLSAFALTAALSLSGCATHKEVTAPCKRPEGISSYAGEARKAPKPAADQLNALAGATGGCGPLYPVNVEDPKDIRSERTAAQP